MTEFVLFVLFILLLIYIRKTNQLSLKIGEMEKELRHWRNTMSTPAATPPLATPPREATAGASLVPPQPSERKPAIPAATIFPQPVIAEKPSRTREEWESLIGSKLLNRIGAFALILGVGFFLNYAFDNDLIPESIRVLLGFVIGAGLLWGGARWQKKGLAIFAQGLVGAGIAILYLSVYASFNFYHLVPQPAAFVLMSAVTALTFLQALKYDSLAVALLGWAGGFLTPVLLSTGQSNEAGLFTYLALLDLGLLALIWRKEAWIILEPLTLVATYLMYLTWYERYYTESALLLTLFFVTIFWCMFYVLDVLRISKGVKAFLNIRQVVAGLNALFFYIALYNLIDKPFHTWMSTVTLLLGGVYFLTFYLLRRRGAESTIALARYVLTAISLLVSATAIQFSSFMTVTFWAAEALLLIWCGVHWKMRHVWQAALVLFALAVVKLFSVAGALEYVPVENFILLLNKRALTFVVLSVSLGASAFFLKQVEDKNREMTANILHGAWSVLLFILCTVEANDYFQKLLQNAAGPAATSLAYSRDLAWAALWAIYSLPLVWFGLRHKILPIIFSGLGSLSLAILLIAVGGIAFVPIEQFTFALNWRAAAFAVVIAAAVLQTRRLNANRQDYKWLGDVIGILQIAVVLLVLDLLTGETRDLFKRAVFTLEQNSSAANVSIQIARLNDLQQLALSGVWLVYSALLMVAGIWRRLQGLRIIAIALFGVTILKIFIYDLSFLDRLYRIFSFIGLGVILLAVSYLYQRYKAVIFEETKKS